MRTSFAKAILAFVLLSILSLAGPRQLEASTISYTISADISFVSSGLSGVFAIGTPVTVSFVVDSSLVDADPNPQSGYYGPLSDFSLTISGYGTVGLASGSTTDLSVGNYDATDALIATGLGLSGPTAAGGSPRYFQIGFFDNTATALSSDALPVSLAGPFSSPIGNLTFTIGGAGGAGTFVGSISFLDNVSYSVVAPPIEAVPDVASSVALLVVGLGALGLLRCRISG